ncbi:phosphotransferase [Pedococcus sp. 5OH_020]|uniref:phosphotransferase n=1 Tax=Pedococcus sp. 5OH_020 TaxID=2989814 RepID=UPI0022E9E65C|nr:phosphotransferase [Pedococcus sp. 5OH_020]
MTPSTVPPSAVPTSVLLAFGVDDAPRLLAGGQGTSWVAGDLVLKPGGGPLHEWLAAVAPSITQSGFRLAVPVAAGANAWSVDGWTATRWVEGRAPDLSDAAAWGTVIAAGRAFHQAIAHLPRPELLRARTDWWAVADQAAWGERELRLSPEIASIARRLETLLRPLGEPQIVHGDLTHNVLVHPGLPPAIIDVSPYWRPVAYAEGVVVADALCWHAADASMLDRLGVSIAAAARALLFRLFTTSQRLESHPDAAGGEELRRYEHATLALGA